MRLLLRSSFVLAFAMLVSQPACTGPLVESGGYHVSQEWYAYDAAIIRPKAAFAFTCPPAQIALVVVGVSSGQSTWPTQIGVSGCGHKGIFVFEDGEWVLTGVTDTKAPPQS
jgi:hypothetical protein